MTQTKINTRSLIPLRKALKEVVGISKKQVLWRGGVVNLIRNCYRSFSVVCFMVLHTAG